AKLGPSRVRELVLATAFVPREGKSLVDTLTGPLAAVARRNATKGGLSQTPAVGVRVTLLNGVPRARRKFMADRMYPESARILAEKRSVLECPMASRERGFSPVGIEPSR